MAATIVTRFTLFFFHLHEYKSRKARIQNQHVRYNVVVSEAYMRAALTAWEYAAERHLSRVHVLIAEKHLKQVLEFSARVRPMTEYEFSVFGPHLDPAEQYLALERAISAGLLLVQVYGFLDNPRDMIAALKFTQNAFAKYVQLVEHRTINVPPLEFEQMKNDVHELTQYVLTTVKQLPNGGSM